jgi:hypothetical protein
MGGGELMASFLDPDEFDIYVIAPSSVRAFHWWRRAIGTCHCACVQPGGTPDGVVRLRYEVAR